MPFNEKQRRGRSRSTSQRSNCRQSRGESRGSRRSRRRRGGVGESRGAHQQQQSSRSSPQGGSAHEERRQQRPNDRHRSKKERHRNIPLAEHKSFSLRLSRGRVDLGEGHSAATTPVQKKSGIGRFHIIPNRKSRRGRSSTPKSRRSTENIYAGGGGGISGKLRSLSRKGSSMLSRKGGAGRRKSASHQRAPSLQPHQINNNATVGMGHPRKRGKSLPSRFASMKRSKKDEMNLGSNLGETWAANFRSSSGNSRRRSRRSLSKSLSGDEMPLNVPRQHNSADEQRKRSVSNSCKKSSNSRPQSRSRSHSGHFRSSEGRRSRSSDKRMVGHGRAAQRGRRAMHVKQKASRQRRDHQSMLNNHCREHFKVLRQKQRRQMESENEGRADDNNRAHSQRSKSLPPLGTSKGVLYADHKKLAENPVSPVASVDSSWRYKRLKQKLRMDERRRKKAVEEKEQVRSKSCEPSLWHGEECRGVERSSCDDIEEKVADANKGVIVPFSHDEEISAADSYVNYKLAYNLGEIDGDFIFFDKYIKEEKKGAERANGGVGTDTLPKQHPKSSVKTKSSPQHKPIISGTKSGFQSSEPNREDSQSHNDSTLSREEFTFGTYEESGTWRGQAPDPVKSLHGSSREGGSTILSPGGTFDDNFAASRIKASGPRDPPTVATGPRDPPVTANRSPTPESFVELARRKSHSSNDTGAWSEAQSADGSKSSQSKESDLPSVELVAPGSQNRSPLKADELASSATDDRSIGSLADDAPSTIGTTEKKTSGKYGAPPLHSEVRSKKPLSKHSEKGSAASSHHASHNRSSQGKPVREECVLKLATADAKEKNGNKIMISEVEIDERNDQISAITMPPALLRAPPPHARVRAKKPRDRNGSQLNRRGSLEENSVPGKLGSMTGNEIDIQSISNFTKDPVSELTIPLALHPPFAQALRSFERQQQQMQGHQHLTLQAHQKHTSSWSMKPIKPPSMPPAPMSKKTDVSMPMSLSERLTIPRPPEKAPPPKRTPHRPLRPPPPKRQLPPPLHRQQHQLTQQSLQQPYHSIRVAGNTMKQHSKPVTVHDSIEDLGLSFFQSAEQQLQSMRESSSLLSQQHGSNYRNYESESIESIPLKPPRDDVGLKSMRKKNSQDGSQFVMDVSVGETTVHLDDAAAQLLSVQSSDLSIKAKSKITESDDAKQSSFACYPSTDNSSNASGSRQPFGRVENMPYMDEFNDTGFYTGDTDEFGQPHGWGRISYESGTFFEGEWNNGTRVPPPHWRKNRSPHNSKQHAQQHAHGMMWG